MYLFDGRPFIDRFVLHGTRKYLYQNDGIEGEIQACAWATELIKRVRQNLHILGVQIATKESLWTVGHAQIRLQPKPGAICTA